MSTEENHCLRCGALLPEGEEGICPACGTPFGRATQAMKVDPEHLRRIADERRKKNTAPGSVAEAAAAQPEREEAGNGQLKLVLIGVSVLLLLLAVVIAFVR